MGPLEQVLSMIPGMNNKLLQNIEVDEKRLAQTEAIIKSMTKQERANPSIINASRRRRIAAGSGTTIQQVNKLLKDFEEMRKMFKMFSEMGKKNKKGFGKFRLPF